MVCKACEKPKKVNYRKGLWSPDEDQRLSDYIQKHGHGSWSKIAAKTGLQRNGKSCRLRWINYLRPGLKHSAFSQEEEATILKLHAILGNKWSQMAMHLPGRTDNEVKNHFNTYLKKKVVKIDGSGSQSSPSCSLDMQVQFQRLEEFLNESESSQKSPSESSESLESTEQHLTNSFTSQFAPKPSFHKVLFADWLPTISENVQVSSSSSLGNGMNCQQDPVQKSQVVGAQHLQSDCFTQEFEDPTDIYAASQRECEPMDPQINDLLSFDDLW